MPSEAQARIKINKLLEQSGWRLIDAPQGRANVCLENKAQIKQKDIDAWGNDFEKTSRGFIDFLLLDKNSFPICVLEAKAEDKDPLIGKEQARRYAQSENVRFVILSNGNLHYFWDIERDNPTIITDFPTQESITHFHSFKPDPTKLVEETVNEDYVVLTQLQNYKTDPSWLNESEQEAFKKEKKLKFLRPYQIKAIKAIQNQAQRGKCRFLFEMATGTGKTLVSAGVIKLFLRTGNAKRVLFLVDRLELEDQAHKNLVLYLKNDYTSVIYKDNREDWRKAEIIITTIQTMSSNNRYLKEFLPTDFDLIISDEAHRSIAGNSRAVFEYFVGYKLGLTATPKDYLRGIDPTKLNPNDVRSWERRQLLDTYKTFGCERGDPTYRYSLIDGVRDGFLVNPIVADARTEITTELLSEQGYSVMVINDEGEEEEQTFFQKDFERRFFSKETNTIFCKTFFDNALKDQISGDIGKTIIYCVGQTHASKITQILNETAHQRYPGKYNSDFAVQVTSLVDGAQQFSINFANNNLNGHSKFIEGYNTSKTRVCVTVGMMTTGYDCEDILNLCLMRPIFSPTDFIQMKGRGTRRYKFSYIDRSVGLEENIGRDKERFKLFDFFANCEYFEKKFKYDEILKLPTDGGSGGTGQPPVVDGANIVSPDPLKTLVETPIGLEGMKIDRKFFEKFEDVVKKDEFIKGNFEKGNIEVVEEYIKTKVFDKPTEYYNLEKLRRSAQVDRRVSLREIIEKVFGVIPFFKTKDQLLEDEFSKFVVIYKPDNQHVLIAKNYMKCYINDPVFRKMIDDKEFTGLNYYAGFTMPEFKALNGWRDIVPEYVKDYVSLNKFL